MKSLRTALLLLPLLAATAGLRAQDSSDDEKNKAPPVEIPDFSHLDEYIYQPKSNVMIGVRYLGGIKASFSGNGNIMAPEATPALAPNVSRTYHDGATQPDARTITVDNGDGTSTTTNIPNDGKTNTWNYTNQNQLTSDDYMQFHIYSAVTEDSGDHDKPTRGDSGLELVATHDMGKLGKHFSWTVFTGMSVNDIEGATSGNVKATVTTLTDTYDLFGQIPPAAPYNAPSSTTQTIVNSTGSQITVNGTGLTQSIDTTTLLGNAPLNRTISSETDTTSVTNQWKLSGAYVTFRAGPTLIYNFNDHLKLSVSVGPALIYAGSTYTVTEVLTPPTGTQIVDTIQDTVGKLLPAYYADATLEYDITDRAGFYFGSFLQGAGSYRQTSASDEGSYSTTVDFSDQHGIRTGMSFRF